MKWFPIVVKVCNAIIVEDGGFFIKKEGKGRKAILNP